MLLLHLCVHTSYYTYVTYSAIRYAFVIFTIYYNFYLNRKRALGYVKLANYNILNSLTVT